MEKLSDSRTPAGGDSLAGVLSNYTRTRQPAVLNGIPQQRQKCLVFGFLIAGGKLYSNEGKAPTARIAGHTACHNPRAYRVQKLRARYRVYKLIQEQKKPPGGSFNHCWTACFMPPLSKSGAGLM